MRDIPADMQLRVRNLVYRRALSLETDGIAIAPGAITMNTALIVGCLELEKPVNVKRDLSERLANTITVTERGVH